MELTDVELSGLPVVTVTGERVGKLARVVVDADRHVVTTYVVARARLLAPLLPQELLVRPPQVVSVDRDQMVVDGEVLVEEKAAAVVREVASGIAAAVRQEG